ncbi:protein-S-isoprenylcysteine O-methyltransferase [Strigomonas culicis]|nr:protein-S-isoprenylcysteine O-methyltransferase [Strigomonas culicis]|eukprot:EPY24840.1 protein-S-isoprenylcysteine O-methyltransferase [Strigomonas culicis]
MCEFGVAAYLRPRETHRESFMLCRNGAYAFIHLFGLFEFLVEVYLVPESWKISRDSILGGVFRVNFLSTTVFTLLMLVVYVVRVVAMLQCGVNFSLRIEVEKRDDHELVNKGLYGLFRHPSYFGFFWRSVFYQLIIANPISFVMHVFVTWVFLKKRIEHEESQMLRDDFFGEAYKKYRQDTPSGVPLIQ